MSPALPPEARAILGGNRSVLARLISRVEDRDPTIRPILRALYPHTGDAKTIGLTGPLGVGKSSLLNALLRLLRGQGLKVGIIGVDPTSPFSGGSVLGDRIRIEREPGDAGVFFRSMASRGAAGGVAAQTRDVARLLDAFGMDIVLVETVGSGQVDMEIRNVASTSVVVLVPHLGDEVQSMKAGLFEIADVFCINKADLPGADASARHLQELVSLGKEAGNWKPRVVLTSATNRQGLEELWAAIEAHEAFLDTGGRRTDWRRERLADEILTLLRDRVAEAATRRLLRRGELASLVDRVLERKLDPRGAADRLFRGLEHR
jgi:LAO/AO transport system kinase